MKDMTARTRVWGKPIEQMDVWLDSQGYYRKHTARDGTCLFRAVSEQIFMTQVYHVDIRRQVIEYEMKHYDYFQKMVTCSLEEYCEKMRNSREWGGKVEIEAMARLYKHDFEMFQEIGQAAEPVTNFGFDKKILLCYSQDKHYDSVYTKNYITTAAFCQSTIYEVLYKRVFDLKEVDYAIKKMLYDKSSRCTREHVPFLSSEFALRLEMRENCTNVKDLLDFGITPFPYKVAKSLDAEMYRNVEYDTWNEYRKGLRYGFCAWTCRELQVGVKCLVKEGEVTHHGHIQEMSPNKGPVVVFIEELGKMLTVPYDSLELLPPSSQASSPRLLYPLKLTPLQLQDDDSAKARKTLKNLVFRHRLKEAANNQLKESQQEKKIQLKEEETQNPTITTSNYYEPDMQYQREETFLSQTVTQSAQEENPTSSDSAKVDHEPVMVPIDHYSYRYMYPATPPTPPMTVPVQEIQMNPPYPTALPVNLMASKSVNLDGSDLPHSDVTTLRFFYNLGLDHMRMNCVQWNNSPGNTYYVNKVAPQPNFVIENPTTPVYEPAYVQTVAPVPGLRRREVITSSTMNPECETPPIPMPSRFKNKRMTPQSPVKREVTYEVPVVQQCDVSSTTGLNIPVNANYYPQVEYDPCCMNVPYVDYNVYEYQSQAYTPTSFITPDGLIYQTILPGITPTTTSTI